MLTADWSPPHRRARPSHRWAVRLACVVLCALAFVVYFGITAHGGSSGGGPDSVTVGPGDTVWSVAAAHSDGGDVRAEVDAILRANHLQGGATIVPGQVLVVPAAG